MREKQKAAVIEEKYQEKTEKDLVVVLRKANAQKAQGNGRQTEEKRPDRVECGKRRPPLRTEPLLDPFYSLFKISDARKIVHGSLRKSTSAVFSL
jgi:hypothetical protein